jgi:hypothetical protein
VNFGEKEIWAFQYSLDQMFPDDRLTFARLIVCHHELELTFAYCSGDDRMYPPPIVAGVGDALQQRVQEQESTLSRSNSYAQQQLKRQERGQKRKKVGAGRGSRSRSSSRPRKKARQAQAPGTPPGKRAKQRPSREEQQQTQRAIEESRRFYTKGWTREDPKLQEEDQFSTDAWVHLMEQQAANNKKDASSSSSSSGNSNGSISSSSSGNSNGSSSDSSSSSGLPSMGVSGAGNSLSIFSSFHSFGSSFVTDAAEHARLLAGMRMLEAQKAEFQK